MPRRIMQKGNGETLVFPNAFIYVNIIDTVKIDTSHIFENEAIRINKALTSGAFLLILNGIFIICGNTVQRHSQCEGQDYINLLSYNKVFY